MSGYQYYMPESARSRNFDESLINRIKLGDLDTVKKWLNIHYSTYWKQWSEGYNVLAEAFVSSDRDMIILLLEAGFQVRSPTAGNDRNPLLHSAITRNDPELVDMLLDRDVDVNLYYGSENPLHYAARIDNEKITMSLLKKMPEVDALSNGMTPLHIAAASNNLVIVKCLLDHGAYVNFSALYGKKKRYTPLHFASANGNSTIVKLLLNRGADIAAITADNKSTVLHIAATMSRNHTLKLLLEHGGVNADATDKNGNNILNIAIKNSDLTAVTIIMKLCPHIINNAGKKNYFIGALACRSTELCRKVIESLLDDGFTVNTENANNGYLLHAAVQKGQLKIIQQLFELGADVNSSKSGKNGATLLHTAVYNDKIEMAELLIKHGADVNAKDENGKFPICWAIEKNYFTIGSLLLSRGAIIEDLYENLLKAIKLKSNGIVKMLLDEFDDLNVNATSDEFGRTALHYAVVLKKIAELSRIWGEERPPDVSDVEVDMTEALLSRGADVNARCKNGVTALHDAVNCENIACVEILLKYGANVNLTNDEDDSTTLHYSATNRFVSICKMLLDNGARVNDKDNRGDTALHVACKKSNGNVVSTLLEYGADIYARNNDDSTPLHIDLQFGKFITVKNLLKLMRNEDINDTNVSFYELFTKAINKLPMIMFGYSNLKSDWYKKKCSIYANMVDNNSEKGQIRESLLHSSVKALNLLFGFVLPDLPTVEMLNHLSNEDLRRFIKSIPYKPLFCDGEIMWLGF